MTVEKFRIYKHKQKPQYELVLLEGVAFPTETKESDWSLKGAFTATQLREQAIKEVREKGYSLTRWDIKFQELVGQAPPAKKR